MMASIALASSVKGLAGHLASLRFAPGLRGLVLLALVWTPGRSGACPSDTRLTVRENLRLAAATPATAMARPVRLPVDDLPPSEVGQWSSPREWPLVAIHAALLPTGEVLAYSYPDDRPGHSAALLWDPDTDTFRDVSLDRDVFCSGLVLLSDGTLLMTGGNAHGCSFQGTADVHRFDPFERTWQREPDMSVARWYPSNVLLADGRVLITSGLDENCKLTPLMEVYTPGIGVEVLAAGSRPLELYPRLHLLGDGRVVHAGIERRTWTFDPQVEEWSFVGVTNDERRWAGTSVQVPGDPFAVMIFGGGSPAMATVERLDFSSESPGWQTMAPMHYGRSHANPVVLPDGDILMVGGGDRALYDGPVFHAERYDPRTDSWQLLPAQAHPRMYHATALLLPDGRVLSAGQDRGPSLYSAEIYEPSYLFRGPRPKIVAAPSVATYEKPFTVEVDSDSPPAEVVLIAPGAVTHGVDLTQRLVSLTFEAQDGLLEVTAPEHAALAPAGYYMLFVLDERRVPSIAAWIRLAFPTKDDDRLRTN